jgi:DNA-binding MarR family transcriptional regulator
MDSNPIKNDLPNETLELQEKLEKLEEVLRPIIPKDWLAIDLTMPQLKVMLTLFREGPTRMSEIASSLGVTLATSTGVVDRLVRRGLVVRESFPGDRRVVVCRLSEEGQNFTGRLWLSGRVQIQRLLSVMTPEQLAIVSQGTDLFIEAARRLQKSEE